MKIVKNYQKKDLKKWRIVESVAGLECLPKEDTCFKTDVDIILHEHDTLRAEIMERMRNQNNLMIIAVTILGAILGYLGHMYDVWVTHQFPESAFGYLDSTRFLPILNGYFYTPFSVNSVPNDDILLFLNDPLPKIIIFCGALVLNSIAALFIHNEKNKTLTVQYLYNYLAPRLNILTEKTSPFDSHLHWRDYRHNRRAKPASIISNFLLFFSYYAVSLFASITLVSITMWGINTYEGLCNQSIFYIIIEFIYFLYSGILIISAVKTYFDKRYSDRPSNYNEMRQEYT